MIANSKPCIFILLGNLMNSKGIPNLTTKSRIKLMVNYLNKFQPKKILLMGGKYRVDCQISLSESMYNWILQNYKISSNLFYLDKRSLDTVGDAIFSKLYIDKYYKKLNSNIIIFTSNFHAPRTKFIFNKIYYSDINVISDKKKIKQIEKKKEKESLETFKINFEKFSNYNKKKSLIYFLRNYHKLYGDI